MIRTERQAEALASAVAKVPPRPGAGDVCAFITRALPEVELTPWQARMVRAMYGTATDLPGHALQRAAAENA